MKKLLIFPLLLCISCTIFADSIKKVDLEYRDAVATQALLVSLFKGDISIVVDGNSLLVRGQNADIQALATMVKRLDKPQQPLRVSLYRGVDPYRGDTDGSTRRTTSTHTHQDNVLDQWIMEDGTHMVIHDSISVVDRQEQFFVEAGTDSAKALLKTEATTQHIEQHQHHIQLTLTDNKQSVRLVIRTQLANRAATGDSGETISTNVESRRMIATNQWVRLFYRQYQANTFTPENRAIATTVLNFDDEQALWVLVEPLDI